MVPYGPVWSRMVPYGPVWSCIVPHGPAWYRMVPHGPVWSRMVLYDPVWSRMVLACLEVAEKFVCGAVRGVDHVATVSNLNPSYLELL